MILNKFFEKIEKIKPNHTSLFILETFMDLLRFLHKEEYYHIREKFKNKIFNKKDIELLEGFVDKICKQEYLPIYIQKKLSNKRFDLNENYIKNITEINLEEIKNKFYYKNIISTQYIIKTYESFCKGNIDDIIENTKNKNLDDIFMSGIENIYKNFISQYRYEIVFRASSKNNKTEKVETELPSLFYKEGFISYEKEIFHDFIAANPSEFENMTTFDKLTKMRHYEVPNRLLDVTKDPLLALYFACGEKENAKDTKLEAIQNLIDNCRDNSINSEDIKKIMEEKKEIFNGSKKIFIYAVKEKYIKYYDSDTVTVLSILSKLKYKDKRVLKLIVDFFKMKQFPTMTNDNLYSFDDCKNLRDTISLSFLDINMEEEIDKYIKKRNELKKQISLFDLCKNIEKDNESFINNLLSEYGSYIIKTKNKKYKNKTIQTILNENSKTIKDYKNSLTFCLKNILVDSRRISYFNDKFKLNLSENEIEDLKRIEAVSKDSKIFSLNELFNFFVSTCVGELNWQLKQEIPGWYENVLDLETFTKCYLVKPKMNNPRIIAQSGAFFIYPFEDTDIKDSLLGIDLFKIEKNEELELKEELKDLNIKETKYMPDDLTKYAEEIRKKYG